MYPYRMTIYIGTIAKDVERSMPQFIMFVSEIAKRLPDTCIVMYENNSTDATRAWFPILQSSAPRVIIKSETIAQNETTTRWVRSCENKACRMECIANARNKLLDMLREAGCSDHDYVLMIDCDIARPFESEDIDVICKHLTQFPDNADAIFANGLNANGVTYYDMYALRHSGAPFGPEIVGDDFWKKIPRIVVSSPTSIYSGFGGMAIYRGYCLKNNQYTAFPTDDLHAVIKQQFAVHSYKQPKTETHYEGALLGIYLFGDDVFYHNNSGYNYPVVCEHSTFHATLAMRGQGRFIIDSTMKYYSGH